MGYFPSFLRRKDFTKPLLALSLTSSTPFASDVFECLRVYDQSYGNRGDRYEGEEAEVR